MIKRRKVKVRKRSSKTKIWLCIFVLSLVTYLSQGEIVKAVVLHGESLGEIKKIKGAEIIGVEVVEGKIGNCFAFNKADSAIRLPSLVINPEEGTIEMWAKNDVFEITPEDRGHRILFRGYYGNKQVFQGAMVFYENRPQLHYIIKRFDSKEGKFIQGNIFFNTRDDYGWKSDEWHHLAFTWGKGKMKLYADGVLYKEVESPGPLPGGICIGNTGSNYPFKGLIDEVVILRTERTAVEILTDFKYGFREENKKNTEEVM